MHSYDPEATEGTFAPRAHLHDEHELPREVTLQRAQPRRVLHGRVPIMDRRGAAYDEQLVGVAVQQAGHLAACVEDLRCHTQSARREAQMAPWGARVRTSYAGEWGGPMGHWV